jgi:hypothetical protein
MISQGGERETERKKSPERNMYEHTDHLTDWIYITTSAQRWAAIKERYNSTQNIYRKEIIIVDDERDHIC